MALRQKVSDRTARIISQITEGIFANEKNADNSESDAESELFEEQRQANEELNALFIDWSLSPFNPKNNDGNRDLVDSARRNLMTELDNPVALNPLPLSVEQKTAPSEDNEQPCSFESDGNGSAEEDLAEKCFQDIKTKMSRPRELLIKMRKRQCIKDKKIMSRMQKHIENLDNDDDTQLSAASPLLTLEQEEEERLDEEEFSSLMKELTRDLDEELLDKGNETNEPTQMDDLLSQESDGHVEIETNSQMKPVSPAISFQEFQFSEESLSNEILENFSHEIQENLSNEAHDAAEPSSEEVTLSKTKSSNPQAAPKIKPKSLPKRKNFCVFCEELRTDFTSHIKRHALHQLIAELEKLEDSEKERKALKDSVPARNTSQVSESERKAIEEQKVLVELESERKKLLTKYLPMLKEYNKKDITKKRRDNISKDLRLGGNDIYNTRQAKIGGTFLPVRRIAKNSKKVIPSLNDFEPCQYCHGLFMTTTLYRHVKYCEGNNKQEVYTEMKKLNKKVRVLKESRYVNHLKVEENKGASTLLKTTVYKIFNQDRIALVAKNDELINLMGSQMVMNHREHQQLRKVASTMRDMARLLLKMREYEVTPPIKTLADAFVPWHFKYILQATKELAKYDEVTGDVGVIGFSSRVLQPLKLCIHLNYCRIIESEKVTEKERKHASVNAELVKSLFQKKWAFEVSSISEKSRKKKEMKKAPLMADTDDIRTLASYLFDLELHHYSELMTNKTVQLYDALCKILICLIIVLNRRRAGEAARILLEYYLEQDDEPLNDEFLEEFSEAERLCARKLTSFQIPGKRFRSVPVILTKQMQSSINLIVEFRSSFLSKNGSKFLFAKPFSSDPYEGSKLMREFRNQIVLKKPEHLTSTGVRHNIATLSSVKNFKRKEDLYETLGHTENMHKQKYVNRRKEVQQGIVGNFLMSAAGVEANLFAPNERSNSASTSSPKNTSVIDREFCQENEVLIDDPGCSKNINGGSTEVNGQNVDQSSSDSNKLKTKRVRVMTVSDSESDDAVLSSKIDRKTVGGLGVKRFVKKKPLSSKKRRKTEKSDTESEKEVSKPYTVEKNNQSIKGKKRWTQEEKQAVYRQLSDCIEGGYNPRERLSTQCIANEKCLQNSNRTWIQINGLVNNFIKGKLPADYFKF